MAALRPAADSGDFLRGLYCHYVFDDQRDDFRRILTELSADATFVDTPTCVAMLEGRTPIRGRNYHLSFDDGFKNNLTNAAPILRELGIPGLLFAPTSYIGGDWESARRFCQEAANYSGVIELMSWQELAQLPDYGIEVGSHTRTHPRLAEVTGPAQLRSEIVDSKRELEDRLGTECRYFSWPFGRRTDVSRAALDLISESGYEACFGAYRGRVEPGTTDRWSIPRHHFEPHWPLAHIRYFLSGGHETAAGSAS